ncbi:hypothetical protein GCM10009850_006530 [Nonomuraea monospora]|uniref:Pentapeptide repeat-containing protein n=2 Tax=Nonomuraea monospora TaxID=568818 RepID=A0ABN3C6V8_9ACTN
MPAYFDIFEWAAGQDYDHVITVETDMVFIKPGFTRFIAEQMKDADYLAPGLRRNIPASSQWPAYLSLKPELPELLSILGMTHTNRSFSPGQVFGRDYLRAVVTSDIYPALRGFVERNQRAGHSYSLQELLLPTLADRFGLTARSYPDAISLFNRYRPFQTAQDLALALDHPSAFFLHPVARTPDDQVRALVREPRAPHAVLTEAVSEGKDLSSGFMRGHDLRGTDLAGADLREAALNGASIVEADLRQANLSMAFLDGACLKSALLTEAILSGACLRGADLREVNLRGAFLNGADLCGAFLGDADLTGADLREATLAGADLREADVGGADLRGASLQGALLSAVTWTETTAWPSRYLERIRSSSRQVAAGRFLIADSVAAASGIRLDDRPINEPHWYPPEET